MEKLLKISAIATAGIPASWLSGSIIADVAPGDQSAQALATFLNQGVLGACVVVLGVTAVQMAKHILQLNADSKADFKASQQLLAKEREEFQAKLSDRDREWASMVRELSKEQAALTREMIAVSTRMVDATELCRRQEH